MATSIISPTVNAKIEKLVRNADLQDQIINGSDTTVVRTEGGDVPSLAKVMKELGEQSAAVSDEFLQGLEATVNARADEKLDAMDERANGQADTVLTQLNQRVNENADGILAEALAAKNAAETKASEASSSESGAAAAASQALGHKAAAQIAASDAITAKTATEAARDEAVEAAGQYPAVQEAFVQQATATAEAQAQLLSGLSTSAKKADLAAIGGAANIGVMPDGSGAGTLTVADLLGMSSVDLLSRIPKSQWAAIAARTSVYDCTPALVAAVATGKRVTVSMPGRYKFSTAYVGTTDFDVEALCRGVEFDLSGITAAYAIQNSGSISAIPKLSADVAAGAMSVTFASTHGLVVGNWFCLYDPTPGSWSGHRPYYNAGEWCRVAKVSGNTVTLERPLYAGYLASVIDVYKLASVRCRIANIHCIGGAAPAGLVQFSLSSHASFEFMSAAHAGNSVFSFDRCVMASMIQPRGRNAGNGGDDYFTVVGNSQHARVSGGDTYSRRHAITTGGGAQLCNVTNRDIRIGEGAIFSNDLASGVESANFHGNTEDSSFENCSSANGFTLSGKDNFLRGCKTGANSVGVCVVISEVVGGTLGIYDMQMSTTVNPQLTSRAIIDIGGNSVTAVNDKTVLDTLIDIKRIRVTGRNLNSSTALVTMRNAGSSSKVSFDIQDVALDVNLFGNILIAALSSGVAATSRIVVDGITGAPSGTKLYNATGGAYLGTGFPLRMQEQRGVWQGTSAVSTSVISAPITLPLVYPKVPPPPILSLSGRNGATSFNGQIGAQTPNLSSFEQTAGTVRPQVRTAANMTAGVDFDVAWSVGIREC